jgi:hypothetical protein
VYTKTLALNTLIQHTPNNAVFVALDADMLVSMSFIHNACIFAQKGKSAYFPIVWSRYSPQARNAWERFSHSEARGKYDGQWRPYGYGMVAMHAKDIAKIQFDESFTSWGGEDDDMFRRTLKRLNVVRFRENGLTHRWHKHNCTPDMDMYKSCIISDIENTWNVISLAKKESFLR